MKKNLFYLFIFSFILIIVPPTAEMVQILKFIVLVLELIKLMRELENR